MYSSDLSNRIYDLEASITKIIDLVYEFIEKFSITLNYQNQEIYTKERHLSELKTIYLTITSLSEEMELYITRTFTKFKLMGSPLKKFTFSIRILAALSMVAEHLHDLHLAFTKVNFKFKKSNSLKFIWVHELSLSVRNLLGQFLKLYLRKNIEFEQVKNDFEFIHSLEFDINKILTEYTPSIINMVRSDLITIEEAFSLTSTIRHFERVGDIVYTMIQSALSIHNAEVVEFFEYTKGNSMITIS